MITDKTLHTLEFDKVLERLAAHTSFSLSKELALALRPATELNTVRDLQQEVQEALRLLDMRVDVSLGGAHDIRPEVSRAALGGTLDPLQLLDVQSTLECAERLRGALQRLDPETFPWLAAQRSQISSFREIVGLIAQTINGQGEVMDSASPALAKIR
ncbi:MAG TPA: endonuclease MutS2, partial [Chloroflexota bacterium]|nr:endonuclease MutS2 [Chloroflexota bacterium]